MHKAPAEFEHVHLAVAAHGEAQHFAQRVDATDAHAVQAARNLVAVLVELAAGVQLGQGDLGRAALGLVLVVHLDAGRDAAAVVDHADRVVGVDGDQNVVAVPRQRFVDGVVHHLEHQVVQAGAVTGVANVHAGALAHRFQAFEDLDRAFTVSLGSARLVGVDGGLKVGAVSRAFARVYAVLRGAGRACFLRSWRSQWGLKGTGQQVLRFRCASASPHT